LKEITNDKIQNPKNKLQMTMYKMFLRVVALKGNYE